MYTVDRAWLALKVTYNCIIGIKKRVTQRLSQQKYWVSRLSKYDRVKAKKKVGLSCHTLYGAKIWKWVSLCSTKACSSRARSQRSVKGGGVSQKGGGVYGLDATRIAQSVERWTFTREARVRLPAVAVYVVVLNKSLVHSCFGPLSRWIMND